MLHDLCNHRCSYCAEANWGGKYRDLKFSDVAFFLAQLFAHYRKDRYHVSFTGGEPTLWPDFARLCEFLKNNGCDIGLTSNGSRPAKYWNELADHLNWTCLSYHPEYARDAEFLRVIEVLAPRTRLAVRLMMHHERSVWEKSIAFGERIRGLAADLPVFVEYVPLQSDFSGSERAPWEYADWQREFFARTNHFMHGAAAPDVAAALARKRDVWDFYVVYDDGTREFCRPNEMVAYDRVNFQGWTCQAGRDLLFINAAGEVLRAGCKIGGRLGFLTDRLLKFPTGPVVCDKNFCPCGTDILVAKQAPRAASPMLEMT